MLENESYTPEEIAQMLKVSKLTVYDLIKKGKLQAYRVGRQMRIDAVELENYKVRGKEVNAATPTAEKNMDKRSIVISGQDSSLDILAKQIEAKSGGQFRALRSNAGSLDNLIAMYHGEADIISTHLFDGDTSQYNIPYVRKLLVSKSFIMVKFVNRKAGLYVVKGNPKQIHTWQDIADKQLKIVNREPGAGARVLLDEQLRQHNIAKDRIKGYENEKTSHMAIASAIAIGKADVGVGIEHIAKMAAIDFIPIIDESYDLVLLKDERNQSLITNVLTILKDINFNEELQSLGYDLEGIGEILWEQ
jgi:putative molybdopterin biosynthesis protein